MAAVDAGADAIGLVLWEPSPRAISAELATEICALVPAFVTTVALTVDADDSLINRIRNELNADILQCHGNESAENCERAEIPYMKAIRMRSNVVLENEIERFSSARSILLDAYRKGTPGGTGESFDWLRIPERYRSQIVLAGGLNSSNVTAAVTAVQPYAVDVSGGVESAPGIKDHRKIAEFVAAVRAGDQRAYG
jgi:phosphoribosylanthranilate isomerase